MKKLIFILVLLFAFPLCVHAEEAGNVMKTDIITYIDRSPIASYNYNGYTYVVAEDLLNYGFHVAWDSDNRTLKITRDKYVFAPYISDFINEIKQPKTNKALYKVYDTDIKTYIGAEEISAYNIGGKTMINTDYLQAFGNCIYDNNLRRYDVDILGKELEDLKETSSQTDTSPYGQTVVTQKGIFDGDTLRYGIKTTNMPGKYGSNLVIQYGDFKNGRYIEYTNQYMGRSESFTYYTPSDIRYALTTSKFQYGEMLNFIRESSENGKEYRYLSDTGELYLVKPANERNMNDTTTNHFFNGQLYKNGKLIYDGEIMVDNFVFQNTYYRSVADVLYAKGYSDSEGVIYYYDKDYPYYNGNVINGVAHGYGEILAGSMLDSHIGNYPVYTEAGTQSLPYEDSRLVYRGHFVNGLRDGEGKVYEYGHLTSEGVWKENKRNGAFRDYTTSTDGKGGEAICLSFSGTYINDKREGFGIEYAELGWAFYSGIYERYVGDWKGNNWSSGKWYDVGYNKDINANYSRLLYDGEFNFDGGEQYGTYYYYNADGTFEVKTGYFVNWEFIRE